MKPLNDMTEAAKKKGYKKTKLGWIPEDWEIKKLSQLSDKIGSGITPRGGSEVYTKNGHPFIRSQNVGWGKLLLEDMVYISKDIHKSMSSTELKKGDLLLNITGASIGRAALVTEEIKEGNVNQHVCIIRSEANLVDIKYLNSFLISWNGQKQIESFQAGGNRQGLNFQQIGLFKIPLPPLPEQKKIAEILSTWDEAIEKLERLISKKEELKKGLMQQLLTGKKRFRGFEGEWKEIKMGSLINTISGGTPSRNKLEYYNGSIPWIKSGELNTRRIFTTEENITEEGLKNSSAKLVNKNTLLLAIYGATAGVISVNKMEKASINQAVLALIPKDQKVVQGFLELWFLHNKDRIVHTFTQGGQPNLSAKIVKGLKINVPEIEEQRKISKLLFSVFEELEEIKSIVQTIKTQKQGLMQQLLSGKRRVTNERQ